MKMNTALVDLVHDPVRVLREVAGDVLDRVQGLPATITEVLTSPSLYNNLNNHSQANVRLSSWGLPGTRGQGRLPSLCKDLAHCGGLTRQLLLLCTAIHGHDPGHDPGPGRQCK